MSLTGQSNLPTVQRLKYEDFADAPSWQKAIELLVNALNLFLTPVYNILNGGVGYSNLTLPQLFQKTIVAGATTSFSFMNPLTIAPSSVVVGNVWSNVPSNHPAVAVQVMWHVTNGNSTIVIDSVIGLTAGTQYVLTLVVQ